MSPAPSQQNDCSCTVESRDPLPQTAKRALLSHSNYDFQASEIVLPELPEDVLQTPEPRPIWPDFQEPIRNQEFVSYSAFPNPPPRSL